MLDLRGANAKGQAGQGPMCAGVRIATDNRHARQGGALLGADHMDDALAVIAQAEISDLVGGRVGIQGLDLQARGRV